MKSILFEYPSTDGTRGRSLLPHPRLPPHLLHPLPKVKRLPGHLHPRVTATLAIHCRAGLPASGRALILPHPCATLVPSQIDTGVAGLRQEDQHLFLHLLQLVPLRAGVC